MPMKPYKTKAQKKEAIAKKKKNYKPKGKKSY